ncbi:hypothetical protein P0227_24750 [Enterobacter cloacae]
MSPEEVTTLLNVVETTFAALAAENAGLKDVLECVINPDNQPEYHDQGMGCGVEDRGYQRDGYSACYYGWDSAMERVYSEVIPDSIPETTATDAFLAEVRAQESSPLVRALTVIANSEQHDGETVVCDFDTLISVAAGALRDHYAAQLRKGVQS